MFYFSSPGFGEKGDHDGSWYQRGLTCHAFLTSKPYTMRTWHFTNAKFFPGYLHSSRTRFAQAF